MRLDLRDIPPSSPSVPIPSAISNAQIATLVQGIYTDFDDLEDAEAETA